jgi:glycosyltransferase involved in cell wall biosynthesis
VPKVSIVIPVYNSERYLPECLDSVLAQTLEDIEVICVNDGSTDGSASLLESYAGRDSRVTVIDQRNQGCSTARNAGLDHASGEFVLFLDSDDYFEPVMVEEAYDRCHADDADIGVFKIRYIHVVTGTSIEGDWSLRVDLLPDKRPFSRKDVLGNIFLTMTPCVWNKLFRRSFLSEEGLRFSPELSRAEDIPFTYLALMVARRITVIDKPLVNYRTGLESSMQATIHDWPLESCRALMMAKNAAIRAGVYEDTERDFAGAALHQCLYTLESLRTAKGFRELYGRLKSEYFESVGISGRSREFFDHERHYEQYLKIMAMSPEDYLFDEASHLRTELEANRNRLKRAIEALDVAGQRIEDVSSTAESLQSQLEDALTDAASKAARLKKTKARLRKIQESRSYRIGQSVAYIPRNLKRFVTPRKEV